MKYIFFVYLFKTYSLKKNLKTCNHKKANSASVNNFTKYENKLTIGGKAVVLQIKLNGIYSQNPCKFAIYFTPNWKPLRKNSFCLSNVKLKNETFLIFFSYGFFKRVYVALKFKNSSKKTQLGLILNINPKWIYKLVKELRTTSFTPEFTLLLKDSSLKGLSRAKFFWMNLVTPKDRLIYLVTKRLISLVFKHGFSKPKLTSQSHKSTFPQKFSTGFCNAIFFDIKVNATDLIFLEKIKSVVKRRLKNQIFFNLFNILIKPNSWGTSKFYSLNTKFFLLFLFREIYLPALCSGIQVAKLFYTNKNFKSLLFQLAYWPEILKLATNQFVLVFKVKFLFSLTNICQCFLQNLRNLLVFDLKIKVKLYVISCHKFRNVEKTKHFWSVLFNCRFESSLRFLCVILRENKVIEKKRITFPRWLLNLEVSFILSFYKILYLSVLKKLQGLKSSRLYRLFISIVVYSFRLAICSKIKI